MPATTKFRSDTGLASLEFAIVVATLIGGMYLMVFALQLATANHAVQDAASEGARAASIVNEANAQSAADSAVAGSLGTTESICAELRVETASTAVDVTVTVDCRFPVNNLPTRWLGISGSRTFSAEATEIIDTYRGSATP